VKQVLMFLSEIENNRPLACLTKHVNPHKRMKDPTSRRMLHGFPLLIGKRRIVVFERFADAVFSGGIHQQAHGHHH
jgi:hypothetical protein